MKVSKSLEEVWKWKKDVQKETDKMNKEEVIKFFNESSKRLQKKYNFNLKEKHIVKSS